MYLNKRKSSNATGRSSVENAFSSKNIFVEIFFDRNDRHFPTPHIIKTLFFYYAAAILRNIYRDFFSICDNASSVFIQALTFRLFPVQNFNCKPYDIS